MKTFTTRDLQRRRGALMRHAAAGELSIVTKRGKPLLVAVPIDQAFADQGHRVVLAVKLVSEGKLTPAQGARFAGITLETILQQVDVAPAPEALGDVHGKP